MISPGTVVCAFCGGRLHHWFPGDKPFLAHARSFWNRCSFVTGRHTANVTIGSVDDIRALRLENKLDE